MPLSYTALTFANLGRRPHSRDRFNEYVKKKENPHSRAIVPILSYPELTLKYQQVKTWARDAVRGYTYIIKIKAP